MSALPYVTSPGNVRKALEGIISAATPERLTQDFVKTILQIPGGSGDQITSFLKKLGFAAADGTPTETYRQFRNPSTRHQAAETALRRAYEPLFKRNEFVHKLPEDKLRGLIIEVTGAQDDSSVVTYISSAFKHVKSFADFARPVETPQEEGKIVRLENSGAKTSQPSDELPKGTGSGLGLNLAYTINLNLPATSDISVFNAIFKSLKENLLKASDE